MAVANAVRSDLQGLPEALKTALGAIEYPDVREMLRRLADYNLGIFMPHMHDDQGAFQELPDGMIQIEDGLEVSFRSKDQTEIDSTRYVPTGWVWAGEGATTAAGCRTVCVKQGTDTNHYNKHEK